MLKAWESWRTILWEKFNKIHVELIASDSGNVGYGVSECPILFTFVALYAIKDELKREGLSGDIEAKFSFYGLTWDITGSILVTKNSGECVRDNQYDNS